MMSDDEAAKRIGAAIAVTREDVVRAKRWISKSENWSVAIGNRVQTDDLALRWLSQQKLSEPKVIRTNQAGDDELLSAARAYSARLAFYQAVLELVNATELVAAAIPGEWQPVADTDSGHHKGGIRLTQLRCFFPSSIARPPFSVSGLPAKDPDVFLEGAGCDKLDPGIHEAIKQALECFQRALYMPATVMLAAAAEATWIVCGTAVAAKLGDASLDKIINDQFASISKKVAATSKALESATGKGLLKTAGVAVPKVAEAETWTTVLRDKRNALHWSKSGSFIADHAEAGTLLLTAPLHLGTLEAIRSVC